MPENAKSVQLEYHCSCHLKVWSAVNGGYPNINLNSPPHISSSSHHDPFLLTLVSGTHCIRCVMMCCACWTSVERPWWLRKSHFSGISGLRCLTWSSTCLSMPSAPGVPKSHSSVCWQIDEWHFQRVLPSEFMEFYNLQL